MARNQLLKEHQQKFGSTGQITTRMSKANDWKSELALINDDTNIAKSSTFNLLQPKNLGRTLTRFEDPVTNQESISNTVKIASLKREISQVRLKKRPAPLSNLAPQAKFKARSQSVKHREMPSLS